MCERFSRLPVITPYHAMGILFLEKMLNGLYNSFDRLFPAKIKKKVEWVLAIIFNYRGNA